MKLQGIASVYVTSSDTYHTASAAPRRVWMRNESAAHARRRKVKEGLEGLPAVLDETLIAHPEWVRYNGKVVCAGDNCDWIKPANGSISKRWRNHIRFELMWSIGEWYDNE